MKTMNELELDLVIKIRTKDEELLRKWGFAFHRNAQEILESYFHNIAEEIRFNLKMNGRNQEEEEENEP